MTFVITWQRVHMGRMPRSVRVGHEDACYLLTCVQGCMQKLLESQATGKHSDHWPQKQETLKREQLQAFKYQKRTRRCDPYCISTLHSPEK